MSDWSKELVLAIEIGLLAYGVFAGVTIVLERRRPAATLAWILALVLVPVVGLVAYLLIGRRKARRSRRSRRRLRLRPTEATAEIANLEASPNTMTPQVTGLLHLALSRSAAPIRHADAVQIMRPRPAATSWRRSRPPARGTRPRPIWC